MKNTPCNNEFLHFNNNYDAIVVGSGISGGWAAKELTEKGLKTLLIERGNNVEHIKDYTTALKNPWEFTNRLQLTSDDKKINPIQSQAYDEANKHFFVNDSEHPYIQESPFNWIRGYQLGGRSLTWGRQTYRWSDLYFMANSMDGHGIDWPIRYKDLAPWYSYVERFIGISGNADGINHLPDGEFLPPMELNYIEKHLKKNIEGNYQDRQLIIGRVANLTRGYKERGPCQYRNLCSRGCPFSGYFSSNSATLPVALSTGNLTIVTDTIVYEVIFDNKTRKAKGVRVIDANTGKTYDYFAKIIFLNASTIATTSILLQSKSLEFPNGLGNSSGELGKNLMDHHKSAGAYAVHEDFKNEYYFGRRPTGFYIPRFRNLKNETKLHNFVRGYGFQGHGERSEWIDLMKSEEGYGTDFKNRLTKPGPWTVWMGAWGECLPNPENKIELDPNKKDKWGLPQIKIHFNWGENENNMKKDIMETAEEMLAVSGFKSIKPFDYNSPGGSAVHEMGTARMGKDPRNSVLNEHNQMHDVKNIFITDGSCMTSGACQNPSLTYMALTARAVNFAVNELNKLNL